MSVPIGLRRRGEGGVITRTLVMITIALLLYSCKKDLPSEPPDPSLILLSYLVPTEFLSSDTLTVCWEAKLVSASDSIMIQVENLEIPGGIRTIAVHAAQDGCISLSADSLGSKHFKIRLRSRESGILSYTAELRVVELARGIKIVDPKVELAVLEDDTLHLAWITWGLPSDASITVSVRSSAVEAWEPLQVLPPRTASTIVFVKSMNRTTFRLRVSALDGEVEATSPMIHVIPDSISTPILVLSPSDGDTVLLASDAIQIALSSGWSTPITGIELKFQRDSPPRPGSGRLYDLLPEGIPYSTLMTIHPGALRWDYYFALRAQSDTHWISFGPVYVFDYRITTQLSGQTLQRGKYPDVGIIHSSFGEPSYFDPYPDLRSEVELALSTDGGNTWHEERAFLREKTQVLLPADAAFDCYLRMRSVRGARVFEDIAGPFTIVDNTVAMFEWNINDTMRYQHLRTVHRNLDELDTLSLTVLGKIELRDSIVYTISEYSARYNETKEYEIVEDKTNMHKLTGWRLPDVHIYRYADASLPGYTNSWHEYNAERLVEIEHGIGIVATRSDTYDGYYKKERLTLLR